MLDNKDVSLNAKFSGGGDGSAKTIKEQDLEFKGTGINLVTHGDGKFEVLQNGKQIGNETNYNKDQSVIDTLKKNDITLSQDSNVLKAVHGDRSLSQQFNGGYINDINEKLMDGDKGLLSQTIGAIDTNKDGITQMTTDINKDGKVDANDTINYDLRNQFMVKSSIAGSSSTTITPAIQAAIEKDYKAGLAQGSAVKGFNTNNGYDERQWNEYIGAKLYSINSDSLLQ